MTENNFQVDSAAISDRGLSKKRPENQDSFLESNERGLFIVADGVGGAQAGDVASKMAVEILSEAFVNLPKNIDAEDTMRTAIERANESIFQMARDSPQLSTMATTIVALQIQGNIATIGHVGDSRLYRLDANGNLHRETQDHSMVEEEVRAGRMTAKQAATHPNKNIISRALGADYAVEVDLKTIMFEPGTTFLVCSDGITRHLSDSEIRDLLFSEKSPANVCQKMKEICYERGAEDNLTAVIAIISGSGSENLQNSNPHTPNDFEESTIASARPIEIGKSSVAKNLETVDLSAINIARQTLNTEEIDTKEFTDTPDTQKNRSNKVIVHPSAVNSTGNFTRNSGLNKGGFLGKFLSALLFLIVGAALGAGGFYFWLQKNKLIEVPPIIETQPQNTTYAAFEKDRRSVDRNPEQYIFYAAGKAESTESFYLLGRAYLLTGKNLEALKAFGEAKNRLVQVSEIDSAMLANDIAMSLAIINNSAAQREFDLNKSNINRQTINNSNKIGNSTINNLPTNNQQF